MNCNSELIPANDFLVGPLNCFNYFKKISFLLSAIQSNTFKKHRIFNSSPMASLQILLGKKNAFDFLVALIVHYTVTLSWDPIAPFTNSLSLIVFWECSYILPVNYISSAHRLFCSKFCVTGIYAKNSVKGRFLHPDEKDILSEFFDIFRTQLIQYINTVY